MENASRGGSRIPCMRGRRTYRGGGVNIEFCQISPKKPAWNLELFGVWGAPLDAPLTWDFEGPWNVLESLFAETTQVV